MFTPILRQICQRAEDERFRDATDTELLRQFWSGGAEAPFRTLVSRHGPMVFDVCRVVLRNRADAEDAFQVTFLALARQSGSIRQTGSLSSWLYGVAYRTALKARARAATRRAQEARVPEKLASPDEDLTWGEVQRILHEELTRLAERYRAPLVLCYLQGRTQDEAAARLGLTKATLKRRLEHGRALLRTRLVRRGLGSAAALASAWPAASASVVPAWLMASTMEAAALVLDPGAALLAGLSVQVAALADDVLQTAPTNGKMVAAVLLVLATIGTGAAVLAYQPPGVDKPAPPPAQRPGAVAGNEPGAGAPDRTDVYGDPLPPGALARMGTGRLRHTHLGHLAAAFSPDGKVLASNGSDTIRLWDPATGKLLREIRDGDDTLEYCNLRFAPDGRWLAAAGRNAVCVWDTATGRRLHRFPANSYAVVSSRDGKRLAGASDDGSVGVWETETGRQIIVLREAGTKNQHRPISFTADGAGLVTMSSWSADRLCHWTLADGKLQKEVAIPVPARSAWVLSPDGRLLASAPRDGQLMRGPITIWDTATGKERLKLKRDPASVWSALKFSAEGSILAENEANPYQTQDSTPVALWDTKTGERIRRLDLQTCYVQGLDFSPDGRTLMTMGTDQAIRLWDAVTGKPALEWPAHQGEVQSLVFTPDGRSLISGGIEGSVRLWEVASGRQVRELIGHRWRCDVVAVTADGRSVLSGGTDGCIWVQDLNGKESRRFLLDGPPEKLTQYAHIVLALGVTPDGKTAATWSRNPNAGPPVFHVWDLGTGRALVERPDLFATGSLPRFSPDARLLADYLYEDQPAGPAPAAGGGAPGAPGGGGAMGRGRVLAGLRFREIVSGRQVLEVRHSAGFLGLTAFSTDGRVVVTGTSEEVPPGGLRHKNALHVWELATGKERLTVPGGEGDFWFQTVAIAPDGRTAATTWHGTIRFWDVYTGKELMTRTASAGQIHCLAFSPDSRSLATGHRDGSIFVWEVPVASEPTGSSASPPDAAQIERWWAHLADDDARKAYAAIRGLAAAPGPSTRFLGDHVLPITEAPAAQLRQLIADLDSPEFQKREAATEGLTALGEQAGPALRAALKVASSAEQRRRIERLLRALDAAPSGETLRQVRAIEVLELARTGEARAVLEKLTGGAPDARQTREAQAAFGRLNRR
jgi:RNA polymerase sigma factor (sigma-70 family)